MNTPFPGMDPYLEHPALWPGVHNGLIAALAAQLQPLLMPRYVAAIEQRVYIEGTRRQRVPDVHVEKVTNGAGGTAVAQAVIDTPLVLEIDPLEIDEWIIQVLDRYRDMKVVTVIKVVSPANKSSGPGRRSYRRKQREVRASECHLVEIDLVRRGRHVLSARKRTFGRRRTMTTSLASAAGLGGGALNCTGLAFARGCRGSAFP